MGFKLSFPDSGRECAQEALSPILSLGLPDTIICQQGKYLTPFKAVWVNSLMIFLGQWVILKDIDWNKNYANKPKTLIAMVF